MNTKITTPQDILRDAGGEYTSDARKLLDNWDGYKHGVSPSGAAAAAYYAAGICKPGEAPTQEIVAERFDVCLPTIRKHYRDIIDANAENGDVVDMLSDGDQA